MPWLETCLETPPLSPKQQVCMFEMTTNTFAFCWKADVRRGGVARPFHRSSLTFRTVTPVFGNALLLALMPFSPMTLTPTLLVLQTELLSNFTLSLFPHRTNLMLFSLTLPLHTLEMSSHWMSHHWLSTSSFLPLLTQKQRHHTEELHSSTFSSATVFPKTISSSPSLS